MRPDGGRNSENKTEDVEPGWLPTVSVTGDGSEVPGPPGPDRRGRDDVGREPLRKSANYLQGGGELRSHHEESALSAGYTYRALMGNHRSCHGIIGIISARSCERNKSTTTYGRRCSSSSPTITSLGLSTTEAGIWPYRRYVRQNCE